MALGGWWDEHVVPRVVRCGCGAGPIMEIRREVVPLARGAVFELGCGGGLNQPLYDPALVTSFAGIDPSAKLLDYAQAEARAKGWDAQIGAGVGEDICFPDASFDTVVSTFTLCSVDGHGRTLAELHRILRPGGRLLYAEHGLAPDAGVARWQRRIEPAWKHLFGNCHLTRPVSAGIAAAGFATEVFAARYMHPGPRFAGWMEWGVATKPG
jgi:SAM-dependent methyltransferase